MTHSTYAEAAFALTLAGLLFSGYLSATKLLSDTCAFGESCPYVLGYPACWYGFAMYAGMFAVSALLLSGKAAFQRTSSANLWISAAGLVFAGYLSAQELAGPGSYSLGLPTCAYGFIMYLAILLVTLRARRYNRPHEPLAS